jgi:hypothetical protein
MKVADLLCYRFNRYPLWELRRFLGEERFTEFLIKFSGTTQIYPTLKKIQEAHADIQLFILYSSTEEFDEMNENDKLKLKKISKILGISANAAKMRAKRVAKRDIPRCLAWVDGIAQADIKTTNSPITI